MPELRESGIEALGKIPWGSHFCNFYETKQDLLDTVVPYFKTGLESKEFCLWIVSNSGLITVEDAKEALKQAVPDFEWYFSDKNIEILNETNWYLEGNVFNLERVINSWHVKLNQALALGYDGMRVSGDTFWLTEKDWKDFIDYEKQLTNSITDLPMTLLCTYPLAKSGAAEILDVAQNHQFAIVRRKGEWEMIETGIQLQAQTEIKRLNKAMQLTKERKTRPAAILSYGVAVLSVIAAIIILLQITTTSLDSAPHVSVFLCAVIVSAWFGGIRSGLLAVVLSALAFDYYFLPPFHSFAIETPQFIRLLLFIVPALFIVWLNFTQRGITNSLRRARNVLEGTVQKLRQTNAVLQAEIAERRQAEDALRKSEDSIRLIIDTIPIMAWSLRPDGVVDFVNKRWLDYTGEESIDDPNSTIHPEDSPGVMEKWKVNKAAGNAYEDEMRLRQANGEYRWFLVRTAPLHDEHGKIVKWYGVSIDIEDSKRAEGALKESEQQYLSLFENMAEGVAYFQMLFKDDKLQDAIYLEVNPAWEKLTGLKNVLGRKITEVLPNILESRSELFERSVRVALTCQPERFETYSTYLKRWLSVSAYCPKKEHVILVFDDITERKHANETLQQSYEEIRRLTEHLQKIREEERTSIAREIHDELGQQLTAIKMDVAWIDKKTPEETIDIKRKLKNIIELLDGSNQSIRRILSELRPRILDDHGWLESIEWLSRQFTETTNTPVQFRTPEKDIKVSEQIATCIFRVCQEAFTNIARYSQAKNVSISISIIEENIILIIEDDGTGFDPASVQNKKTFGILGMRERVLSLAGKFELISSPGKGTKITVSLPYRT